MTEQWVQDNIYIFILISLWELIWKGIALWKAGKNGDRTWFVLLLILNTIGILPIVYVFVFSKRKQAEGTNT